MTSNSGNMEVKSNGGKANKKGRQRAYLSLGSNVGNKQRHLALARQQLMAVQGISMADMSPLYVTDPVGLTDQDDFLNQVVAIDTRLTPGELLRTCQAIEAESGRVRSVRWGPRTLDIDILLYGDVQSDDPLLTLPHPRMLERAFVLIPLAHIAPDLVVVGRTVSDHLARLDDDACSGVRPLTGAS